MKPQRTHHTASVFFLALYVFLILLFSSFLLPAFARDINLDDIYLAPTSLYRTKLLLTKLDAYYAVGSQLIDRNVIFSGWCSDSTIAYLREVPGSGGNIVTLFNIKSKVKTELARFPGDVLYASVFPGGKFMGIKRMVPGKDIVPDAQIAIINLVDGKEKIFPSSNVLLDFTISPEGDSIIKSSQQGISSIDVLSGLSRIVIPRSICPVAFDEQGTILAYPSFHKHKWALISGGGGSYRLWMIDNNKSTELKPISSASEIYWIDANTLAYRLGAPGSYQVILNDISQKTEAIIEKGSFNTSLRYFPSSKTLSWLKDGIIIFYRTDTKSSITVGMEGDDVALDFSGSRFISTLGTRLFLTDIATLRKKNIEIARIQRNVLSLYKEVRKKTGDHLNEYSAMYLDRKIALYEELVKGKK